MQHATLRRATLGFAAIMASLTMYACSTTGHATGTTTIDPPFVDPISVTFTVGNDGTTTCTANGGPEHANKCVEITYSDAEGNTTGTTTLQTDGNGSASGQVPPGSVRWSAAVVDCPEPEPEVEKSESSTGKVTNRVGGGGMFNPQSAQAGGSPIQAQKRSIYQLPKREFIVQGGPIVPSDTDINVVYYLLVQATSFAQANALAQPVIVAGPGALIPPGVEVIAYSTMEATLGGARFVQAQPGQFQSWSFDFNQGAFYADHNTALNYQLNGWDVMETFIPLSAFDFGVVPSVTYSNNGTSTYSTDLLGGVASGSYGFSFSSK